MRARTFSLKTTLQLSLAAGLLATAATAGASVVTSGIFSPAVMAGAPPDTPAAHVDPDTSASQFSGVVSINIRNAGQSFICSGALVGKRSVISAAHCIDADGNGTVVDLSAPGTDVRVVFNSDGAINALMTAVSVSMNPQYQGFGNCPAGVTAFCLNDDVAVITLGADAPASAKIYKVATNGLTPGSHITMVGYGMSGTGTAGYTEPPDFTIKRRGENFTDMFDQDDELGFSGRDEVYYADFDGAGQDSFCAMFGICTPQLPNSRESSIAGGDSGGPSFVNLYGELVVVANNTFTGRFAGQEGGTFGTFFGGMVLGGYADFLEQATDGDITFVPEPGSIALLGLSLLALLGVRRKAR